MFYQKFFGNREKLIKLTATAALYDTSYSGLYPPEPKNALPASTALSKRVNLQARRMGVNNPIKVYTSKNNSGQMMGVNGPGKWNSMLMILDQETEKNHDRFIMSHEIAHAKHNDILMKNLIALAGIPLSFLNISIIFAVLVAWGAPLAYSRYAEKRADLTAAAHLKNIEIAQKIRFFHEIRSENLNYRNSPSKQPWDNIKKKLTISSTGDPLLNFTFPFIDTHPSYTSRINYLTKFIEQRPDNDPITYHNHQTSTR